MSNRTMRAAVIREWRAPASFSIEELDRPQPGPGELLIAVHTAAVNFGDTLIATGRYQVKPVLPFVAGAECSGVVAEIGEGVTAFGCGDRIAVCGFVGDARRDGKLIGALAEFVAIPAASAVRVPDNICLEQAALFRSNTETSAFALRKAGLAAGETLLVLGAGGGTGYSAVQLGKLAGARVLASASSPEKRAIALEAGADAAVDSQAADWRTQVDAFAPRGVDVVYDPLGASQTERAFRTLGWNGRHLVVGFAAGEIAALPCNLPLLKGASLVGANLLQAWKFEPELCAAEAERLMGLFGTGHLRTPPIGGRYALDQAAEAYMAVASGRVAGRVVVRVGGADR